MRNSDWVIVLVWIACLLQTIKIVRLIKEVAQELDRLDKKIETKQDRTTATVRLTEKLN